MRINLFVALLAIGAATGAGFAAAAPTTYQVTGPVLAITADTISVQKGTETWAIVRDAKTKALGVGAPAVGKTVTIKYWMTAASIEVKPDK